MKREILISATQREVRVAILEDDQLVELQVDRPEARRMVGDIYWGKVDAVLPGLQAAFVDIGTEKSAFLHNSDLAYDEDDDDDADDELEEPAEVEQPDSPEAAAAEVVPPAPKPRGRRRRKEPPQIQDALKKGQEIIVQVSKEPISSKGPRVTAQVSLAGRFLVYMPFASRVGVSRKIGDRAERQRLRAQVESVMPKNSGGVIVRTVGEDVTQETFKRELDTLIGQWNRINKKTRFVGKPPKLLHRETSLTRGIIRDLFSTKVDRLTVDSRQLHNEIVEYLNGIAPELVERVQLYEDKKGLFDHEGIETEIRDLFKRRCDLPSGGYLIIEPTEALVSVDVNSGRYTGKKDPEKTILRTNLEAARELARQMRLRDVGGIIVADFIDMESRQNRDKVLQELRTHLGRDRARTKAFSVSDLGLIEMTRQRVRQSHLQSMTEPCEVCHGTGRVFTSETIVRRMERSVRRMGAEGRRDHLLVRLHPDTAMYVLEQEPDLMKKLEKGLGFNVEMRDDPLLRPDEFKLVVKGAGRDVTQQYAVA
ncbi:MAG: Rne/Rng family ribonuclease [Gemmatimonadetes bacterium]|nr:Rne/Rng family ribonuclease [Gemmatimonadota bacterium]